MKDLTPVTGRAVGGGTALEQWHKVGGVERESMGKLPFVAGLFWKTLAIVVVLVVLTWFLIVRFGGYTITAADYGGTTISTVLLAYLVHLWLMPGGPQSGPHE